MPEDSVATTPEETKAPKDDREFIEAAVERAREIEQLLSLGIPRSNVSVMAHMIVAASMAQREFVPLSVALRTFIAIYELGESRMKNLVVSKVLETFNESVSNAAKDLRDSTKAH